jgi:hypothetical protein
LAGVWVAVHHGPFHLHDIHVSADRGIHPSMSSLTHALSLSLYAVSSPFNSALTAPAQNYPTVDVGAVTTPEGHLRKYREAVRLEKAKAMHSDNLKSSLPA